MLLVIPKFVLSMNVWRGQVAGSYHQRDSPLRNRVQWIEVISFFFINNFLNNPLSSSLSIQPPLVATTMHRHSLYLLSRPSTVKTHYICPFIRMAYLPSTIADELFTKILTHRPLDLSILKPATIQRSSTPTIKPNNTNKPTTPQHKIEVKRHVRISSYWTKS